MNLSCAIQCTLKRSQYVGEGMLDIKLVAIDTFRR